VSGLTAAAAIAAILVGAYQLGRLLGRLLNALTDPPEDPPR